MRLRRDSDGDRRGSKEGVEVGAPDAEGAFSHAVRREGSGRDPAPDRRSVDPKKTCDLGNREVGIRVSRSPHAVAPVSI